MSEVISLFTPNKVISKSTLTILISVQAISFLLLWMFSPFVFLPTQGETLHALGELWGEGLGSELIVSFTLNLEAIGLASLLSLILAYLTVIPFFQPMVVFVSKLRFLSLVGLTFFFTLAANNGHELKLYLLIFSISVFYVTSMADVLNSIPKVQFDLARTLRMGPWRIVWEVIILGQMDKVFDVTRQNAAMGWMMLTMVEGMSRSDGGVGAMLLNQNKHFHLAAVLAIQGTILLFGLGQDYAIGIMKNIFCPYALISLEKK
jgi:NitT/TauT family transport system permease protein